MTTIYDYGVNPLDYNGSPVNIARYAVDGSGNVTGLIDPSGATIPIISVKTASGTLTNTTPNTGSETDLPITAITYDPYGLVDVVNEYVNVPTDATFMRVAATGQFAAAAGGTSRHLIVSHWLAGVVWVATDTAISYPHASIVAKFQMIVPTISISPATQTRIKFSCLQDSGGGLAFSGGRFNIDFLCT